MSENFEAKLRAAAAAARENDTAAAQQAREEAAAIKSAQEQTTELAGLLKAKGLPSIPTRRFTGVYREVPEKDGIFRLRDLIGAPRPAKISREPVFEDGECWLLVTKSLSDGEGGEFPLSFFLNEKGEVFSQNGTGNVESIEEPSSKHYPTAALHEVESQEVLQSLARRLETL